MSKRLHVRKERRKSKRSNSSLIFSKIIQARKRVNRRLRNLLIHRMIRRAVRARAERKINMIAKSRRVYWSQLRLLLQKYQPSSRKTKLKIVRRSVRRRKASPCLRSIKSNLSLLVVSTSKSTAHRMQIDSPKKAQQNRMKVNKFPSYNQRRHYSQKNQKRRKQIKF